MANVNSYWGCFINLIVKMIQFLENALIFAFLRCCKCVQDKKGTKITLENPRFVLAALLLWNFGLLIVDRILRLYMGFFFFFTDLISYTVAFSEFST